MNASDEEIQEQIEGILTSGRQGLPQLMQILQRDLRRIAQSVRQDVNPGETLSTTALIHEAYIKLSTSSDLFARIDHKHFLALAARAMRYVVINWARDKMAQKRGAGVAIESLNEAGDVGDDMLWVNELIELNSALEQLERIRPRLSQVVQLRYFAGLNEVETADVLQLDPSTVRRDWVKARGWLYKHLNPDGSE